MTEQTEEQPEESEFMREIRALQCNAPYERAKQELRRYLGVAPGLRRVDMCHGWLLDDIKEAAPRLEADGLSVQLRETHTYYYLRVKIPAPRTNTGIEK